MQGLAGGGLRELELLQVENREKKGAGSEGRQALGLLEELFPPLLVTDGRKALYSSAALKW